jgi:hypothetical protein
MPAEKEYRIRRADADSLLTGDPAASSWADAEVLHVSEFPWHESGDRQATAVRMLYDDENLYLQFRCEDKHIYAAFTELNSHVCRDSCVELFATVDPDFGPHYFNLEMNCCGTMLLGWGDGREDRKDVTPEQARQIEIVTSEPGPTREESPDDDGWWLAARVPFAMLREFTGREVSPQPGTLWRGNVYRCGGKTDDQYACWAPIDAPRPDFHRPEFFGTLRFV